MKGPGIKDYLEVIENMKVTAQKEGKAFIEVNSKELHANVSPNHATMPTCCQAIYKLMLEGDEILRRPKGNTGFGSHLTVRFYVEQLEERERMFPNKKRGRPAKSEEEKLRKQNGEIQRIYAILSNPGWVSMAGNTSKIRISLKHTTRASAG